MADSRIPGSNSMSECSTAALTAPLIYAVPDDLIKTILQRLGASDLCHVASCCRWLRDATNQDSLWRPLCQSKGWEHYGTTTDLAKIASYGPSEQAADASEAGDDSATFQKDRIVTDDNTAGLTSTCRWKGVYMRAYHLDRNWATNSSYSNTFYIDVETNPNPRHRIVLVDGDLLALHNVQEAIQVFDIRKKTLQCVIPTIKPAGLVKFKDGVIVVPFESGVARAFEARTGKLLQTIDGKWRYERVFMFFDGELVITRAVHTFRGEESKKFRNIYVWCVKDGKLRRILKLDPTDDVDVCYNVDYRDKMAAASLDDDYIHVWDVRSGECLHKLKCPGEQSKVHLGDNVIVGFSTKGDACVTSIWSQDTGECQKEIHVGLPGRMFDYTAEIMNNLILIGFSTRSCAWFYSVYAYNLRGELVTKVKHGFSEVKGQGSKRLHLLLNEPVEGKGGGDDELSVSCGIKLTPEGRREYESRKRVIFNTTPNGLVPLFDACPTNIIWIDEIRMIRCDDKEHRIRIHHYW